MSLYLLSRIIESASMQTQHKKKGFETEVEERFKYLFNFGGEKYKTTKQNPFLAQLRLCSSAQSV